MSEAGDGWKGRVTFTKSGCILHEEERGAPVSGSDLLNLLPQSADFIPGSQQGKTDLNLVHRSLRE